MEAEPPPKSPSRMRLGQPELVPALPHQTRAQISLSLLPTSPLDPQHMAHSSMDRRLCSPAARRSPTSTNERSQHHHRFLHPGAFAQLCDSKIIALSLRSAAVSMSPARLLLPSSPAPSSAAEDGGSVPHFLGSVRGLWYLLQKKLAAARSVVFLPLPSPYAAKVFLDTFAAALSELVAAH